MEDSIGKRIKTTRKNHKMTQVQLADKAFISESYLALIELDKRHPSTDVIIRLAEVLNVSSDYLLLGDISQNDMTLFNEWKAIMQGRTADEIVAAQNLLKCFFDNLDSINLYK